MADPRFGISPVKTEQVHKTVRSLYIRLRVSVKNKGVDQQVKPIRIAVRPAFPRGRDLVAGLEPDLPVFGVAKDHSFRSPGENNVTRLQRHEPESVAHDLPSTEDEIINAARLTSFAVDPALDLELVWIKLVGGDQARGKGQTGPRFCQPAIGRRLQAADRAH